MLNSAAGVTFPRPIAPPIRTIRSGLSVRVGGEQQGDVGQRPDRNERRACDMLGEEVDCMLFDGLRCGGGKSGPSRPVSPWT